MDNSILEVIKEKTDSQVSQPLSKRVVRGGLWVFALRIINRGLGFIKTIILARLLVPEDFGLLGIAMLSLSTLEIFSQTGFREALIQKKKNVESYLDTAWTVSVIRGLILFFILFFSAPLIANFFNTPDANLIIKIVAISTLLSGFRNVGVLFFQKELEFNKQFYYEFSATIVHLAVAIPLAFILRNVWALVWGSLAANLARLFMSYMLHPYRPTVSLQKDKYLELFQFGRWVLGSSIVIFLITQGDDILVAKMLGVTALGFYQIAYLLSNLPATEITHVMSQVTFPAYSNMQNDIQRLRHAYVRVLQLTTFTSMPLAAGIFVLAPVFIITFLGEKWIPMVPAMQVLCIFGATRALNATTGAIFYATGKPYILTKISSIQLVFLGILIYPLAVRAELVGVSWAVTLANLLCFILSFREIIKILDVSKKNIFNAVYPSIIVTLTILGSIYLFSIIIAHRISNLLTFIISIIIALTLYSIFAKFMGFSISTFLDMGTLFTEPIKIKN
jgi:O-antigen/teichoic acid export membrane protein